MDAFRLCSGAIPNVERIKACLGEHVSELSPTCRVVYERAIKSELEAAPHKGDN